MYSQNPSEQEHLGRVCGEEDESEVVLDLSDHRLLGSANRSSLCQRN